MKPLKAVALLLVLLPTMVLAQKKPKKPDLPAVFASARFVYVEAMDGDEFKPGLYPEDRQAIADVEDFLREWKRYALTTRRADADLVFVVRKGRAVSGLLHGGISGGSAPLGGQAPGQPQPRGTTLGAGGEAGPPDDLLKVCMVNPDGKLSGPLWMRSLEDGLNGPHVPLLRQFRIAVDSAYPGAPAALPTKP